MTSIDQRGMGVFADRETPLIRNCWYVAGLSEEIGRSMLSRTILEMRVLFYRTSAGEVVALHDRCPHRSYPLSRGILDGDDVMCGYHGMRFGADGRCTGIPSNKTATPSKVAVTRFPVEERGPLIWIWMGDIDKADPALIPFYDWMASPDWVHTTNSFEIDASYVALHENLLDLTHFPYLHPTTVGTPEYAASSLEVIHDERGIGVFRKLLDQAPPPAFAGVMGLVGRRVNRFSESIFVTPAANTTRAWFENPEPREGERDAFHLRLAHFATPISRNKFLYRWFAARNFALDDENVSAGISRATDTAFQEDLDTLQAIQETLDIESVPFRELSFASDKPGLEMRRLIVRLAKAEDAGAAIGLS
ncbi:MAG: aromatic ring-hydroxylating dioxygenase subunit alpha [Sphingomonadales bacterium]|nr:aromatic ring-hydroxylating dioxygenase subunit alpha [Sphingomonadales bacterium]